MGWPPGDRRSLCQQGGAASYRDEAHRTRERSRTQVGLPAEPAVQAGPGAAVEGREWALPSPPLLAAPGSLEVSV